MFERYNENARRTIFFGRFEASQYGSRYTETEHLLLGLLRADPALASHFLSSRGVVDAMRRQIEAQEPARQKVSTSVDLPLSQACKRVLAYGAEEAQQLNHKHIGTEHLLLGLLREEAGLAAQLLRERGVDFPQVHKWVQKSAAPAARPGTPPLARLVEWLYEREARGDIRTVKGERVGGATAQFAIYAADPPGGEHQSRGDRAPIDEMARIQKQIHFAVSEMERAIANHEFEKARSYSNEEREARERLRALREQFNLQEPPPRVPLLCIDIIGDEPFSEIQKRCEDYIAGGVAEVWLLHPRLKRAYTVTEADGLCECRSASIKAANSPLELDLTNIFD